MVSGIYRSWGERAWRIVFSRRWATGTALWTGHWRAELIEPAEQITPMIVPAASLISAVKYTFISSWNCLSSQAELIALTWLFIEWIWPAVSLHRIEFTAEAGLQTTGHTAAGRKRRIGGRQLVSEETYISHRCYTMLGSLPGYSGLDQSQVMFGADFFP